MDEQKGRTITQIAIDYMNLYKNSGAISSEITKDAIDTLIKQAEEAQEMEGKHKRLVESYKELTIQENAVQGHYQLAFKSMQMYKKCCADITLAMNTERPAEEKTKDVRRILDGIK